VNSYIGSARSYCLLLKRSLADTPARNSIHCSTLKTKTFAFLAYRFGVELYKTTQKWVCLIRHKTSFLQSAALHSASRKLWT
jgi:hypothetical protein